jgi:hypothetical protein
MVSCSPPSPPNHLLTWVQFWDDVKKSSKFTLQKARPSDKRISRYIHLNPRYWKRYTYSSFCHYLHGSGPNWLDSEPILRMFSSKQDYTNFVADYEAHKLQLEDIKHSLADH